MRDAERARRKKVYLRAYHQTEKYKAYDKARRQTAKFKARASGYRKTEKDMTRRRAYLIRKRYGISSDEFDALLRKQGGLCAICFTPPKRIVIDHDHDTGTTRSLLCDSCNKGIGFLRDDPKIVESALKYLKGHKQ